MQRRNYTTLLRGRSCSCVSAPRVHHAARRHGCGGVAANGARAAVGDAGDRGALRRKVAVILVGGAINGVRAVMTATQAIPIVFTTQADPVAAGVVASLNRPGGNVTGVTGLGGELGPKRLEQPHELIPKATKFAVLVNPTAPITMQDAVKGAQTAARRLGLEIIVSTPQPRARSRLPSRVPSNNGLLGCMLRMRTSRAGATRSPHCLPHALRRERARRPEPAR